MPILLNPTDGASVMEPPLNYVTGPNDRYHLNQFRGFLNYIRLKVRTFFYFFYLLIKSFSFVWM